MKEIKLYLVFNDRMFRESLRVYLESFSHIDVIGDTESVKTVKDLYIYIPPETIIIVDEKVDFNKGFEKAIEFLGRNPKAKVMMLFRENLEFDTKVTMKHKKFIGSLTLNMTANNIKEEIEQAYYENTGSTAAVF